MPETPMSASDERRILASRITELEIKLSFAEDTVDRLNDVVVRHQRAIDQLTRELVRLVKQSSAADAALGSLTSLRDELPPHY